MEAGLEEGLENGKEADLGKRQEIRMEGRMETNLEDGEEANLGDGQEAGLEGRIGASMGASKEANLGHAEETGVERRMEKQVGSGLEGRTGTGLEEDLEARLGESLGSHRVPPRRRSSRLQVDRRRGSRSVGSIFLLRSPVTSAGRKVDSENCRRIASRKSVLIMPCDNELLDSKYRYVSRGEKGRPTSRRVSHEEEESLQLTVRKHRDYEICTKVDDENFQLIKIGRAHV